MFNDFNLVYRAEIKNDKQSKKGDTMKKGMILLILILSTILLVGESEIYLFGGVNLGSISYNDSNIQSSIDMSTRVGVNLGVDLTANNFKGGVGYAQFGSNFDLTSYGYGKGSDTYNYLTFYGTFCHQLQQLKIFGGIQGGKCIGGTTKIDGGNSSSIDADIF